MSTSSRLTKYIREEIAGLTLRDAFEKEITNLLKERMKVIDAIYNSLYTAAERKALNAAPKDCLYTRTQMEFRTKLGHYKYMQFNGTLEYQYAISDMARKIRQANAKTNGDAAEDEIERPVSSNGNMRRLLEDPKVQAMLDDHEDKCKDLSEKYAKAKASLFAVLESVHTFKKLNFVWPEGLKYYSVFDTDNTKPGLPAVMVDELNKTLGLK